MCWHGYLSGARCRSAVDLHMAQLMPLPSTVSCSSKSRLVLPFWYRLTRVVPDKGPLNGCVCVFLFGDFSINKFILFNQKRTYGNSLSRFLGCILFPLLSEHCQSSVDNIAIECLMFILLIIVIARFLHF